MATNLLELADTAYPAVDKAAFEVEQARYYAQRLTKLTKERENVIQKMSDLASKLPNRDLKNS